MKMFCIAMCFLASYIISQEPLENFQCDVGKIVTPVTTLPECQDSTNNIFLNNDLLSKGYNKPQFLDVHRVDFEHRGVSMPQWSQNGQWLAVQYKSIDQKIPYAVKLFNFSKTSLCSYDLQYEKMRPLFHSFCWSSNLEFCVLSANFDLYWGIAKPNIPAQNSNTKKIKSKTKANAKAGILVYPLQMPENLGKVNITQPSWIDDDTIAFLAGNQIQIAELTKSTPRALKTVYSVQTENITSVSYFRCFKYKNIIQILLCGSNQDGSGLFLVEVNSETQKIIHDKLVAKGTFKLPEWNNNGTRALVYEVKSVDKNSTAQELYLYLYTPEGSGPILSQQPTIQNQEKEPQHDYLGPSWSIWKNDDEYCEGILHFFKQTNDTEQSFTFITFPNNIITTKYSHKQLQNSTFFSTKLGRGRRIAFAKNQTPRVAFVYYDPISFKVHLYIGMLNFLTY